MSAPEQTTAEPGSPAQVLAGSPLLSELDDKQIAEFLELVSFVEVDAAGSILVREGDDAQNFYMIVQGEAEVLKREPGGERDFPISRLRAGDHFGETALFREVKRTATIRAATPMTVAMIQTRAIREAPHEHSWLAPVLLELVRHDANRVDRLTNQTVVGLRAEVEGSSRLGLLGRLISVLLLGICVYVVGAAFVAGAVENPLFGRLLMAGLQLGFGAALVWLVHANGESVAELMRKRAAEPGRELYEVTVATVGIVAGLTAIKGLLISTVHDLRGYELFSAGGSTSAVDELLLLAFFVVAMPAQELCVRGIVQTSLESVLVDLRRGELMAIVVSSALLAVTYSHISALFAVFVFVPGVVWGLLYARHRSLIGVSLSHIVVAVWAMRVLGLGELAPLL